MDNFHIFDTQLVTKSDPNGNYEYVGVSVRAENPAKALAKIADAYPNHEFVSMQRHTGKHNSNEYLD